MKEMRVGSDRTAGLIWRTEPKILITTLKKVGPRIAPRPDLTGARGTSARATISFYVITTTAAVKLLAVESQDHQRAQSSAFAEGTTGPCCPTHHAPFRPGRGERLVFPR